MATWGRLGAVCQPHGRNLESALSHLGISRVICWATLGYLGPTWNHFGPCWAIHPFAKRFVPTGGTDRGKGKQPQ